MSNGTKQSKVISHTLEEPLLNHSNDLKYDLEIPEWLAKAKDKRDREISSA